MKWLDHRRALQAGLFITILAGACLSSYGQAMRVRPAMRPRPLDVSPGGNLSVSITPGNVSFALVSLAAVQGSSGVTITTSWDHVGNSASLSIYGYFSQASAALSDGNTPANLIPSSSVLGQCSTGVPTSYTAFTQTTPFGGAGLQIVSAPQYSFHNNGMRTDVLNLKIDLSGLPNLPAGTYTGTLTVQAQMN